MVLGPTGGHFHTADGTAFCGDHGPAVFTFYRNFFSPQITFQFRTVGCKLDPALELSAHGHEKLVMRLDVIFADLADGHAAGKGYAFVLQGHG